MLLRGTRQRTSGEIIDWIRRIGGAIQAVSGRNSLGLSLEITRGQLSQGISLLGELIREPSFPAGELEKERSLALALLSAREEDPFAWGMKRLMSTLFTQHPYRLDPYGDEESLRRIQCSDLATFYERLRNPQEMVLSVVGDFKESEILPLLQDSFGSMPSGPWAPISPPEEPPLQSVREHREETTREEALLMIGFPGLRLGDPRVAALELAETILSGGAGRLFTKVREARGLAYTVGAFAIHGIDPGGFVLYAVTDPSHLSEVREALFSELRLLRKERVSQEEFQQAQQGLLGARRIARQSLGSVAAQMALDELYGLGWDFSERYEAQVKATTPQEIQRVAQELLDPDRCVILVGQPEQVPLGVVE
jgi:zinc protease